MRFVGKLGIMGSSLSLLRHPTVEETSNMHTASVFRRTAIMVEETNCELSAEYNYALSLARMVVYTKFVCIMFYCSTSCANIVYSYCTT